MFAGLILFAAIMRRESLAAETYPERMECIVAENQVTLNLHNKGNVTASFAFREEGLRYRIRGRAPNVNFVTYSEFFYPFYDPRYEASGIFQLSYRSGSSILWEGMSKECYSALMEVYTRA